MRCKKEEFIEGAIFHIFNHSTAEINLFNEKKDYEFFLRKFKKNIVGNLCEIYAYCLMPNHFHFCLKQNTEYPIYKIFNNLSTSYSMYFNRKHKRKGHLFAGKLQHKQLHSDNYLISLCQYIHYNPLKAGLVNNIDNWEYSNYLEYTKKREGELFSKELIQNHQDIFENYKKTLCNYEKFIQEKGFIDLLFDE